ncbi:MAG: PilZ domain-containing protein [Candidatus Omnitrophota bacterium]
MMNVARKFVRFSAPVYLKVTTPDSPQSVSAIAKDVSLGGAKIIFDKAFMVERENMFSLFLLLPEKTLPIAGKVMWIKEYSDRKEVGMSFLNMPDAYKEDIYNHIFKYHRGEITKKWWQM